MPTVVPTDSRPLSWPPIGALPRNRLASSATGGASPISPTTRPHRASSPCLRRAGCPHLAAATHRALKTPCHCEPVRTLVWQSVLPPRTAPHKGNELPRRCAPRNDIFVKIIPLCVGVGDCPPSCQPIPVHCRGRQSGHFLETGSLLPPPAALRRFPRRPARIAPPRPASVGRGAYTPPPPPTAPSKTRVIANQCAHWCDNPYSPTRHHIKGTDCHVAALLAMTFFWWVQSMSDGRGRAAAPTQAP